MPSRLTVLAACLALSVPVFAQLNALSQEQNLNTPIGTLSGTMLTPEVPAPMPAALIVAGSGPTDRNGNSAMLRYDKRGIGKSAKMGAREADRRFEDYVNDAAGIVDLLRDDVRFSTITVIGHSEGSLIGMIAARLANADGFVSIAGVTRPAGDVLRDQLRPQLLPVPALWEAAQSVIASLEAGQTVGPPAAFAGVPALTNLFRPSVQPYLISWFKYKPAEEFAKLPIPALVVQGTTDLQVGTAEAETLKKASPSANAADGAGHEPRHEGGGCRSGQAGCVVQRPVVADCRRRARRHRDDDQVAEAAPEALKLHERIREAMC
jgi:pimeloyl-ACP methyl ester carboxylesterase